MAKVTAEARTDQTVVYLGNRNGIEVLDDPNDSTKKIRQKIPVGPKKRCTEIVFPADRKLVEAVTEITDPHRGIWQAHSDDESPAWVAAAGPLAAGITMVLAEHWPGLEVRDPEPAGSPAPSDTGQEG